MSMRLTSLSGGATIRMSAKVFAKLLYLARLQGWDAERLPEGWPECSWHTEVVLKETSKYREGLVSRIDARGLHKALTRVATVEGKALEPDLYSAISQFTELLGKSAFLATEQSTGDTVMFSR